MTFEDLQAMGWSAALRKAHEEHPEVRWEWKAAFVTQERLEVYTGKGKYEGLYAPREDDLCGCAVALLDYVLGGGSLWDRGLKVKMISVLTSGCGSWEGAIERIEQLERSR